MLNKASLRKVGKYVLLKEIGRGGFGTVFKAHKDDDDEIVAIKVIKKSTLKDSSSVEGIRREISLLTRIQHPNIVKGIEVLNSEKNIYMVMEYVDGGDLQDELQRKKKFDEQEAKPIFKSLLQCLAFCHDQGVAHRDLKFENLLLTSSGILKVCDFGLAHISKGSNLCETLVGTEDFICPEIYQRHAYEGHEADMWSAGIILYTMLAGVYPFTANSTRELVKKTIRCKYDFPDGFPPQAKEIVCSLLVARGKDRLTAEEALHMPWFQELPRLRQFSDEGTIIRVNSNRSKQSEATLKMNTSLLELALFQDFKLSNSSTPTPKSTLLEQYNLGAVLSSLIPFWYSFFSSMRALDKGVILKNRTWRLRRFSNCFVGTEAVTWIVNNKDCSREEAVRIGEMMLLFGVCHHVCRQHDFRDDYLFYSWSSEDPVLKLTLNACITPSLPTSNLDAVVLSRELLDNLINICHSHREENNRIIVREVHRDSAFVRFSNAVRDLQVVHLSVLETEEEKRALLVNLYNLLRLHALLSIGDNCDLSESNIERHTLGFSYVIAGVKVTLRQLSDYLFITSRERSRGILSPVTPRSNLIVWTKSFFWSGLPSLAAEPLLLFVTSDYTVYGPRVRALNPHDTSYAQLQDAARRYFQKVLTLNVLEGTISYPRQVTRFRTKSSLSTATEFSEYLIDLCEGTQLAEELREMKTCSSEIQYSVSATEIDRKYLYPFEKQVWLSG